MYYVHIKCNRKWWKLEMPRKKIFRQIPWNVPLKKEKWKKQKLRSKNSSKISIRSFNSQISFLYLNMLKRWFLLVLFTLNKLNFYWTLTKWSVNKRNDSISTINIETAREKYTIIILRKMYIAIGVITLVFGLICIERSYSVESSFNCKLFVHLGFLNDSIFKKISKFENDSKILSLRKHSVYPDRYIAICIHIPLAKWEIPQYRTLFVYSSIKFWWFCQKL